VRSGRINPNAEVGTMHPKAMPVILQTSEDFDVWMTAPPAPGNWINKRRPITA
jgi:putative SOS response-associated peptidase YedK